MGWGLESLAEASGVDECDRLGELPLVALFRWGRREVEHHLGEARRPAGTLSPLGHELAWWGGGAGCGEWGGGAGSGVGKRGAGSGVGGRGAGSGVAGGWTTRGDREGVGAVRRGGDCH